MAGKILLGRDDDYFVGENVIETSHLGRDPKAKGKVLPNQHPLLEIFSYTRKPIRGAYTNLRNTINDIIAIQAKSLITDVLQSMENLDGKSDEAFVKTHSFFASLQTSTNEEYSQLKAKSTNNSDNQANKVGLAGVYQHVVGMICALINL